MTISRVLSAWIVALSVAGAASAQDVEADEPAAPVARLGAPATTATNGEAAPAPQPAARPIEQPRATAPARKKAVAPPPELSVQIGRNAVFGVALLHANRIVTPFRNPEIRTSSTSALTVEDGVIYVTTKLDDPIGLFVFDKADPANAISLTLIPGDIPPVSVRLNVPGWQPPPVAVTTPAKPDLAQSWETEDPYVSTIKSLFKDLAVNKVPDGYGLSEIRGSHPLMPDCYFNGAEVVPVQILEGALVNAIVARVTNVGYVPIEVRESNCKSDRMLGAAAWPTSALAPGESTELYIAVKAVEPAETQVDRPSVLVGSAH